jgi:hypothetical protein
MPFVALTRMEAEGARGAGPDGAGAGSGLLAKIAFFKRSYSAATESNLD